MCVFKGNEGTGGLDTARRRREEARQGCLQREGRGEKLLRKGDGWVMNAGRGRVVWGGKGEGRSLDGEEGKEGMLGKERGEMPERRGDTVKGKRRRRKGGNA